MYSHKVEKRFLDGIVLALATGPYSTVPVPVVCSSIVPFLYVPYVRTYFLILRKLFLMWSVILLLRDGVFLKKNSFLIL